MANADWKQQALRYYKEKRWEAFSVMLQAAHAEGDTEAAAIYASQLYLNPAFRTDLQYGKRYALEAYRWALRAAERGHAYGYYLAGVIMAVEVRSLDRAYEYFLKAYARGYLPVRRELDQLRDQYKRHFTARMNSEFDPYTMYFQGDADQKVYEEYLETVDMPESVRKDYKWFVYQGKDYIDIARPAALDDVINDIIFRKDEPSYIYRRMEEMDETIITYFQKQSDRIASFPAIANSERADAETGIKNNLFDLRTGWSFSMDKKFSPERSFQGGAVFEVTNSMASSSRHPFLDDPKTMRSFRDRTREDLKIYRQKFDQRMLSYCQDYHVLAAYWTVYCHWYERNMKVTKPKFHSLLESVTEKRDVYRGWFEKSQQKFLDYVGMSENTMIAEIGNYWEKNRMLRCINLLARDPDANGLPLIGIWTKDPYLLGRNANQVVWKLDWNELENQHYVENQVVAVSRNAEYTDLGIFVLTTEQLYSKTLAEPIPLAGLMYCRVESQEKLDDAVKDLVLTYKDGTEKRVQIKPKFKTLYYIVHVLNHLALIG